MWLTEARATAGRVAPGRDAAPGPAATVPAPGHPDVSRRRAARPSPAAAPVGANRPPVEARPLQAAYRRPAAQASPGLATIPARAAGRRLGASRPRSAGQRPVASPGLGASRPRPAGQHRAANPGRSREDGRRNREDVRPGAVSSAQMIGRRELVASAAIEGRRIGSDELRNSTRPSCPRLWQPRCYPAT